MIQIKKTILTLVALLAVTTGAWAESKPIGLNVEYAAGDEITSTTDVYVYYGEHPTNHKQMAVKITSTGPLTISMIFDDSFGFNGNDAVYYLPDGVATGGSAGVIPCVGESTGDATVVHVASGTGTLTDPYVFGSGPSGTPVPLTRGTGDKINEWTFTMPGGNVTLEPEYYPQAALTAAPTAINDVPATTDGAIVKAGTVANIGSTETAQGTVMYYVSTTPLDDDALLALAADKWTADVPTAAHLAEGQTYVYYYVRGNDSDNDEENFSDGDILAANALTVTIAAEPTYAVTFADGTPETDKWTASPNTGVSKGQTVTVTYSGERKVKSVKAVKKATDLSKLTAAYTAQDGEILTGTTSQEISIAEGATVTLKNATVNNRIKCLGTATIILADGSTNAVKASNYCAGIQIGGEGTTLTINAETAGTGSLTATGGSQAAGIGTGSTSTSAVTGGNIVINGGTITAKAGTLYGAGIGTGFANSYNNTCGSITINGGTVTATGGTGGSGIGTGTVNEATNTCGAISITGGTVTANKGSGTDTPYSIGIGKVFNNNGTQTCGTITIGGQQKNQSEFTGATYTYPPSN